MKLVFETGAWHEYLHWQQTDPKIAARLNLLIEDMLRSLFAASASPSPCARTDPASGLGASMDGIVWSTA